MRRQAVTYNRDLALAVASRSVMRHRVGCVLTEGQSSRFVIGFNRWLGDPEGQGWSLHAEMWAALRAEEYGVKPIAAFVARLNGRLAKPCPRCLATLEDMGVKTLHYTTTPGQWAEVDLK